MFNKLYQYYVTMTVQYEKEESYTTPISGEEHKYNARNSLTAGMVLSYNKGKLKTFEDVQELQDVCKKAFLEKNPEYNDKITSFMLLGFTKLDE